MSETPMVERIEEAMRRHLPRRRIFREMADLKADVREGKYDNCHMAAAMRMTFLGAALRDDAALAVPEEGREP